MSILRAQSSVSESGGRHAALREARRGGSRDELAELLVLDRGRDRGRLGTVLGGDLGRVRRRARSGGSASGLRDRSRSEAERRRRRFAELVPELLEDRRRELPSSKAQVADAVLTCSVPSRARRAGPCVARDGLARPRPARRARSPSCPRPSARSGRARARTWRSRRSISARSPRRASLRAAAPGRAAARRRSSRSRSPGRRGRSARASARRRVASSSERTSSRRTSGGVPPLLGDHLRLGEQEREHGQPLLALGAEAPQVPLSRADRDVVEVRPETGDAALQIALEPRLERRHGRRLAAVVERGARQAELVRTLGKDRREQRDRLRRDATRAAPRVATCSVHGATASRVEAPNETRRSAAFRCPTAAAYSSGSAARLGSSRLSDRSKYARRAAGPPLTTASRSGVKTSVATSPRSCSAERSGAPFSFARFPACCCSVTSSSTGAPVSVARRARSAPPSRRSGRAAGRRACAARSPACRRAATRAGSSCRRRSRP